MAKQTLNIGSSANDGTGTSLRAGGDLINDNFNEIYTTFGDGTNLTSPAIPHKIGGTNFARSIIIGHSTTGTLNAAQDNLAIGDNALNSVTSGDQNVVLGSNAGTAITTATANVYIGRNSGSSNATGNSNFGLGVDTLEDANFTGASNVAIGRSAGSQVESGNFNVLIGQSAGDNITTGHGNLIMGANIDADSATGSRQLKIAGYDGTTTTTWLSGDSSGNLTTAGDVTLANNKKVIFGDAGENIVGNGTAMTIASSQNITLDAAGDITINADGSIISLQDGATEFLRLQHGGSNNSVIKNSNSDADILIKGSDGGSEITALTFDMSEAGAATFNSNVTVGGDLIVNGTTTTVNSTEVTIQNAFVFEGATADAHETTLTVVDPTADRTLTLPNESGDVIIGKKEGTNFTGSLLIGHATTGTLTGPANSNTGVGIAALDNLSAGDFNTALGHEAVSSVSTTRCNTGLGYKALRSTSGNSNTAIGSNSMLGTYAGSNNTAVGDNALSANNTGDNNTALGLNSGKLITSDTANYNLTLGTESGDNLTSGAGNVIIGSVDAASATGDRQLKIAGYDGTTTTTWISGDSSGVVTATLAANTITSTQLASATTLLILNSSGSTLKTIIGAGS
ncbi:hypothetical protein OAE88_00075 [bacterium]|nr:hypothetical protein [bacterium]